MELGTFADANQRKCEGGKQLKDQHNQLKVAQYPGFLRSTNLESKLIDFFVLLKF